MRKNLGQHFLNDNYILTKILNYADIQENEIVYEIGTGHGQLTSKLCEKSSNVISYEIDPDLYSISLKNLSEFNNLELVNSDGLTFRKKFDVLVSNLPYEISNAFIEWLITRKFNRAIITVQKEFAQKLISSPNNKNYRAVSVISQLCFQLKILDEIPPEKFSPKPKVNSVILQIIPKNTISKQDIQIIKLILSFKGKTLSSTLRHIVKKMEIDHNELMKHFQPNKRVNELRPDEIYEIVRMLKSLML